MLQSNFLFFTKIIHITALSLADLKNDFLGNNFNFKNNFQDSDQLLSENWAENGNTRNNFMSEYESDFSSINDFDPDSKSNGGYSSIRPGNVEFCVKKCSFRGLKCNFKTLSCITHNSQAVSPFTNTRPIICGQNMVKINNKCFCQAGCQQIQGNSNSCVCCHLKPNSVFDGNKCSCMMGFSACTNFNPFNNNKIGCVKTNACEFSPCPPPAVCFLKELSRFDLMAQNGGNGLSGDIFYTCPDSFSSNRFKRFKTLDRVDPERGYDFGKFICRCPFSHKWDYLTDYCVKIEIFKPKPTEIVKIPISESPKSVLPPKKPTLPIPTNTNCGPFALYNTQTNKCDCLWRMHGNNCQCKSYEWFDKRYNLCRKMKKEAERVCKLHVKCVHIKYSYCQAFGPANMKCVCDNGYFYDVKLMKCLRSVSTTTELLLEGPGYNSDVFVPGLQKF